MFLQILWEVTAGQMGKAPAVVTDTPGASKEEPTEEIDDKELEEMKNRLQSLRS